jgi:hypothetical protein
VLGAGNRWQQAAGATVPVPRLLPTAAGRGDSECLWTTLHNRASRRRNHGRVMGVRHRAVPVAHSPRVVVGRAAASAMQLLCPQVRMVGWVAGPAGAFAVQSRCTCYSRHLLRLVDVASAGAGSAGGCQTPSSPWPLHTSSPRMWTQAPATPCVYGLTGRGHLLRCCRSRACWCTASAQCVCVRVTEQMYLLRAGNACSGHREL